MSIKSLLVPLAGDAADRQALDLAARIARRHRSHVTALLPEADGREIPMTMVGDATGGYLSRDLVKTLELRADSRRSQAETIFRQWCATEGFDCGDAATLPSAAFVRETGSDSALIRRYGLMADLVVTVRPESGEAERSVFFESALFEAGKPAIAVPKDLADLPAENAPVQIAWRPAAVSARALSASLPLLAIASEVIVSQAVAVDETPEIERVVAYLAWHGIKARGVIHPGPRDPVRLLNEVAKNGVGMLVMGAYAHSRAHAFVFGGITRHVVENARLPVLFAH